ncbi:PE-PPE domain-containing protein [Mycolicibacterium sp.]|uniref:PE-PPE domain-containing protein n=1 Tax=Mycolicibacterium sp. TaxID=2320850 RepID=UPI001DC57DDB|nr:PE-PPE domain-containing protein [Mycolicibacterium sp.]MCB1290608.1 PE-PPE domain-containing protein [Mycobacterium sp.]MCB9410540.1 PE-PPE domain-containing protein [Mycolicibacterium sp.]
MAAAAAAVTATAALAMGVGAPEGPPTASNASVKLAADEIDIVTTGPLLGLLPLLGIESIPVPGIGTLNLDWTSSNPQLVYNALNAIPMLPPPTPPPFTQPCVFSANTNCRVAGLIASTLGTLGARDAANGLWSTAEGQTLWPGYTPLEAGDTSLLSIFVNDPFRPNGGLAARFASWVNLLGIDTGVPPTGTSPADATDEQTKVLSTLLDLTWAYNPFADFPVTLNPFSLLNSALAALPPSYLFSTPITDLFNDMSLTTGTGGETYPAGDDAATFILAAVGSAIAGAVSDTPELYATLKNPDLPLLSPLRLPSELINIALKALGSPYLLGTPIADILNPALTILTTIGYADVVTPSDIAADSTLSVWGEYGRTFAQLPTQFGTVRPLTLHEWLQVPGDVLNAFTKALTDQLAKPFFGILVPNEASSAAAVLPSSSTEVPSSAASVPAASEAPVESVAVADSGAAEAAAAGDDQSDLGAAGLSADSDEADLSSVVGDSGSERAGSRSRSGARGAAPAAADDIATSAAPSAGADKTGADKGRGSRSARARSAA